MKRQDKFPEQNCERFSAAMNGSEAKKRGFAEHFEAVVQN